MAKERIDARAFRDFPIGTRDDGPIDLRKLLERSAKADEQRPSRSRDRQDTPKLTSLGGRDAEHQLVFDSLADCYKAAISQGTDQAWRQVRDYVMGNLGALVMTRLTTFRDLMNLTLEIDQRLAGKSEDVGALKRFEESWVLPDIKAG